MPRRKLTILASNDSGARPSAIDLTSPPTQNGAAGALEQHRTHPNLGRAPRRLDQPARHVRIERIAPVGTVHRDGKEAFIQVLEDDFVLAREVWLFVIGCCLRHSGAMRSIELRNL